LFSRLTIRLFSVFLSSVDAKHLAMSQLLGC